VASLKRCLEAAFQQPSLLSELGPLIDQFFTVYPIKLQDPAKVKPIEAPEYVGLVMKAIDSEAIVRACPTVLLMVRLLSWSDKNESTMNHHNVIAKIKRWMEGETQKEAAIQVTCCMALRSLALMNNNINNVNSINNNNRLKIVEAGLVGLIKSIMVSHSSHAEVQTEACAVLCGLTITNKIQAEIADESLVELIKKIMTDHPSNSDVQEWSCRLLWTLVIGNANIQQLVKRSGVAGLIEKAINAHPKVEFIGENALRSIQPQSY